MRQIDEPHRGDESHGPPHADRREVFHGVEFRQIEGVVGHRVGQRDRRHVEHHAQQHAAVQRRIGRLRSRRHEEGTADQVADAQQLLRRNPAVGYDSHHGGHEQRSDAHRREETADLQSREVESAAQIGAQRNKPRAPDGVLEEVHNDKAKLNSHNSLILRYFNFRFILVRKRLKQMYEIFSEFSLQLKNKVLLLHHQNVIELWCNGNTTDSGPVILGSNPGSSTEKRGIILAFFHFIHGFFCFDLRNAPTAQHR